MEDRIKQLHGVDPSNFHYKDALYILLVKGPYPISNYFERDGKSYYGQMYIRIVFLVKTFLFLCKDFNLMFYFYYIAVGILSAAYSPFFCPLLLSDIINRVDTFKFVLKSVIHNGAQLSQTLILGLMIIYFISIVGFVFFADAFKDAMNDNENSCTTAWQCYLTSTHRGLRFSGGIGDFLYQEQFDNESQRYRWVFEIIYDLTFFILITVVCMNIIFGIIIETFAVLRNQKKDKQDDMEGQCFICGIDKMTFEKDGNGWKKHIESEHNLWNYCYYIHYLQSKDPTELNGIESYVMSLIEKWDISWFPLNKAKSIKESLGDDQNSQILECLKEEANKLSLIHI
eukprot:TRINITY_DN11284_c0_g1_i2.p1 TRINITY_DN11284_c0_g1~~TRINITY_DN11284_c0_g1_i2.p1  ORF type:complete len:342 (+),score=45.31 TRINITY_DN11284_c0_g1_i2:623-1648(+)